jgi:putative hydrolase of HD superfamily
MEPIDSQVGFLLEADRLKTVLRQSTLTDGSRRENSAEHSWHLALMALVLAEHAPPGVDLARVMTMVVLHDLVEVDAGDLSVYAAAADQARQGRAERAAADRLFAMLPPAQAASLRALWDEFEERATAEAKFARALDRLQPMLINMVTGGGTWQARGITDPGRLAVAGRLRPAADQHGGGARHPGAAPCITRAWARQTTTDWT